MKTLKLLILAIITSICFSLTSCSTYTYAQPAAVEIEPTEVTYTTVITYGVRYYIDGIISYYKYRGLFYYPYYYHLYIICRCHEKKTPKRLNYSKTTQLSYILQ